MHIQQITLVTHDLPAVHNFYVSVLGLREIERPPQTTSPLSGQLTVQAGATLLTFRSGARSETSAGAYRYHFAFDIPPDSFAAARLWLAHRAPAIANTAGQDTFVHRGWNASSVYFYDPVGNVLELIARHNRSGPGVELGEMPFGPHSIVSISEMGLAVDDVQAAVGQLQTRAPGLAVYEVGDRETFTAAGDENGLLIVVRQGRIWYPETGVQALPLPLELIFALDQGQRYRLSAPPFPFTIEPV